MAEVDFAADVTAENGNSLVEVSQEEEPNPERKYPNIIGNKVLVELSYNSLSSRVLATKIFVQ